MRGDWPAFVACIGIAVVAFPWGLLALIPLAVSVGIDLYRDR
jgi:hypothetical protein